MTAYLARRNRSVFLSRIKERMFEIFISNIEKAINVGTVVMVIVFFGALVLGSLFGLADLACQPPKLF